MHRGVKHPTLDLKTAAGQAALHKQYPALSLIEVVGAPGALAEAKDIPLLTLPR